MGNNVIAFPDQRQRSVEGYFTADEWAWATISLLKAGSSNPGPDQKGVLVSFAMIDVVLSYVERLETRLGIIGPANEER